MSGSIAAIAETCSSTASPISSSAPQKTAAPTTAAKFLARGKGASAPPGKPGSNEPPHCRLLARLVVVQ